MCIRGVKQPTSGSVAIYNVLAEWFFGLETESFGPVKYRKTQKIVTLVYVLKGPSSPDGGVE